MSSAPEVVMSEMSEVVIVTLPECVSEDLTSVVEEDKGVVVTAEIMPQPGEEVLSVDAVETNVDASRSDSLLKEEGVIDVDMKVDVEADVFYPITCGDAKATLIWKKFVCPGINVKCVQFNEQLISPKEFVGLAGKSTLKDWKRAIRLNGTMLRKIMDSGELDFYQHAKVCSNTCRSTKIDLVGAKVSVSSDTPTDLVPATPTSDDVNGAAASFLETTEETSEWVTAIGEDTVVFWQAVKDAGLLEEVVEDFQKELEEVLKGLQERVCNPPLQVKDAVLLNNIVQNFGMLDQVKKVLSSHKNQMDRYREQYTRSLAALEQQCDEHRKRAKELKSKSQHLNSVLMTLTPAPAQSPPKRPRLTRTVSSPAKVSTVPTQITLPLNQLANLGKVLTVAGDPAGTNLGGYTLLTSAVPGSELVPDGSSVTVLSTTEDMADSGSSAASTAFVKVLGPQFQLVTLPSTLQGLASTSGISLQQQVANISVVETVDGALEEAQVDSGDCEPQQTDVVEEKEQESEKQLNEA